ncbi:Universal stress protein family protein [Mariniphaga anaerophila]|uniref:Universal stress protein family protein n=1 Tax=Mariniphaga anaerophila TaxID=1484053 RepID=A0A1M4Y9K8_9BACT|nr:universal stress protein [Mariniphaga anaerophila]SHF02182.1 Universal stress protein family protein [Mariniphaga anaerophila]
MKTNLLLLDSYRNIEDLIAYAFSFSCRSKRSLKIVYVFDFNWMRQSFMAGVAGPADPALVAVEKNAEKEFEVAETKIRDVANDYMKKHVVKVPFELKITEVNRIDVAEDELERSPDLILLISNHQSYSEASGGLVGYPNLAEHASCPVFVIPENSRHAVMKEVVFATSFHREDIELLKHLLGLFQDFGGTRVTVLHNEKEFGFEEKLKWLGFGELVKQEIDNGNFAFRLKTKKDIVAAIEELSKEIDPDLLVLLKEKRGFFEEVFSASETKNVLTHFHKPVLIYHQN